MKINSLLWFLFLTVSLNSIGQSNSAIASYEFKKDSVKQLLTNYSGSDQKFIRLKNEYARLCFFNHEFEIGFLSLNEAKVLSDKIGYEEGEIMYYLTLSSFYNDEDEPISTYYRKKAQLLSNSLEEDADDNSNFTNIPEYDPGEENLTLINRLNKALAKNELSNNKEIQANISYKIAITQYNIGNQEKAIEVINSAIRLFSESNEVYPVFHLSSILMRTFHFTGKVDEAKAIELELIQSMSKVQDRNNLGLINSAMASNYRLQGRWSLAIEYYLKTLELLDPVEDRKLRVIDQYNLAVSYENYGMNRKAVDSYSSVIAELEAIKDTSDIYRAYGTIVFPLIAVEEYDKARKYMQLALHDTIIYKDFVLARYNDAQGQILKGQGKYSEAIPYFQKAENGFSEIDGALWARSFIKLYLAESYFQIGEYNKALQYATESINVENGQNKLVTEKATLLLSEIYEQLKDQGMAYKYLKDYQLLRSEKEKSEEINRIADAEIRSILDESQKAIDQLEIEKSEKEKESIIQRWLIISFVIVLISVVIFTLILYRNNQNKQKANAQLQKQKEKIELTLAQLRSTQSQLIQSEKMASLGELTAGIAHEIQNPLNFVNNFSEVSNELIDEMNEELDKGDLEEVKAISLDIKQNLEKINHHGKRADGIVKGMLQHSRSSSGTKEPTDINALADEYLRLAYHGLRAKDKSFNAELITEFDDSIGNINLIPQDMGRVILNLITNAFYAVNEKKQQDEHFKPIVSVITKKTEDDLEIKVTDNGNGIPQHVLDKIFQPFFTTKPTGQGTGLGLSLSYDIVKAHGGSLTVISSEGKGSEFSLTLPALA